MALVAVGQTYVVLASDIDLSAGAIVSLVNVTVVTIIETMGGTGASIALGLSAGIAIGLLCGAVNGLCVAVLRLQAIVTTFATGIVFSGLALWVLPEAGRQVPPEFYTAYAGTSLGVPTVIWILLGAVHREFSEPGIGPKLGKGLGIVLVSFAAFSSVVGFAKPSGSLSWEKTPVELAQARAQKEKRPLLVDFTAAWCLPCRENDTITFTDATIGREAERFEMLRADVTEMTDEANAWLSRYEILGVPTIIFYGANGREEARTVGFVEPEKFLDLMRERR